MFRTLFFFLTALFTLSVHAATEPASAKPSTPLTASETKPSSSQYANALDKALQLAEKKKLHESLEWTNLLHYRKTRFGGTESEADSPYFFASPEGRNNRHAELIATIKGFFSTETRDFKEAHPAQRARCQYPARWLWLSKELEITDADLPPSTCTEFEKFRSRSQAQSVTLVFSSYNINNPSSTFGHSLLRLNKSTHEKKASSPLLDLGINYAANPTTTNPVLYAFFGMVGVFPGTFTALPYYYKVREYSDFDARDLWEYNLNLSQSEIDILIAHIWELGFTYFDYYFFTENCSYHMLTALDVAAPRLHLVERLPYWVIPADTIKTVWDTPGLVREIVYRPSLHKQFLGRLRQLGEKSERDAYNTAVKDFNPEALPAELNPPQRARVLDAMIDKFDMENFSALVNEKPEAKSAKNKLLIARSRIEYLNDLDVKPKDDERPHISHDSARASYTQLVSTSGDLGFEITQRFALHDMLDPIDGYPPSAQIEFFKLTVNGSYEESDFFIRNWDLMSVQTLNPWTSVEKPFSWKARVGFDRVRDQRCEDGCLAGTAQGAAGLTLPIGSLRTSTYFLLSAHGRTSPSFLGDKFTLEAGPLVGLRAILTNNLIFNSEASWQWVTGTEQMIPANTHRLRWSPTHNWSVEAGYRREYFQKEFMASVFYYF